MKLKRKPASIRSKIALAATSVSAVAMVLILAVTAFATQMIMTQSITNTLNSHLDIIQNELEMGNTNISIQGSGAELIQVIDSEGEVISSSTWAEGMNAISDGGLEPGENREQETTEPEIAPPSNEQQGGSSGTTFVPDSNDTPLGDIGSVDEETDVSLGDIGSVDEEADVSLGDISSVDESEDVPLEGIEPVVDPVAPSQGSGAGNSGGSGDGAGSGNAGAGTGGSTAGDDDIDMISVPDAPEGNDESGRTTVVVGGDDQPETMLGLLASLLPEQHETAHATSPSSTGALPDALNTSILGTNGPYLTLERGVDTPDGAVTLAAMTSLSQANEAARIVALILGAITILTLIGIGGASWLLAAKTLEPVEQMRKQVDAITAGDLSARIPVPENDPDLSRLAQTFNGMLSRVEKAMQEQKRFISDASHELKSPVAATRIMLEAAKEHPDAIKSERLTADLRAENERMGGIVGNLLLLAQQDEGMPRIEKHPIDLMDLLLEEVSSLKSRSSVKVDASNIRPVVCNADSQAIRHAVRNLVDNAAKYAQSTVKISCYNKGDMVRIIVSDDGPGIPPADRERVFGRFVRLEEGRSRKKGSTGLGLSVVRTVAEQHDGTARFVDGELGGATAVLTIKA